MAKITLNELTGTFAAIEALNARLSQIESAFNSGVLYRNNPSSEPNEMNNDLDMNSQDIINLPEPTDPTSPVRLQDISDLGALGASQLSELDDVDDSLAPLDSQGLLYNASSGQWETAIIPGFSAIALDDLVDVDTTTTPPSGLDVLTYNNGSGNWEPLAVGGGGGGRVQLTSDVAYTVGPTGDFTTVKEGLNFLLNTYSGTQATDTLTGLSLIGGISTPTATLTLQSGFTWDEQITISGRDASWIKIESVDPTVTVDSSAWTVLFTATTWKVGILVTRGQGPIINFNVSNSDFSDNLIWVMGWHGRVYTGGSFDVTGFGTAIYLLEADWRTTGVTLLTEYSFDCGDQSIVLSGSEASIRVSLAFENVSGNATTFLNLDDSEMSCANIDIGANITAGNSLSISESKLHCGTITSSATQIKTVYITSGSRVLCQSVDIDSGVGSTSDTLLVEGGSKLIVNSLSGIVLDHLGTGYPLTVDMSDVSVPLAGGDLQAAGITGDIRLFGGTIDAADGLTGDLLLSGAGSIVRIEGTWTGTSATPTNTLTAAGIIFN